MEKIKAEIVADSINQQGDRITTYLLTFPRFILAELNTHRVFSKNSASSRAIPFEKIVKMVQEDPFIPIAWQKDHKGMQGSEYLIPQEGIYGIIDTWLAARDETVSLAKSLNKQGVTKQLCNRLLEPFMWHTVLLTGTEFENFFELRCPVYELKAGTTISNYKDLYFKSYKDLLRYIRNNSNNQSLIQEFENKSILEKLQINKSQAEIHIQALAEAMWDAMNESIPNQLEEGEWHIPFGDNMDEKELDKLMPEIQPASLNWYIEQLDILKIKVATARCARLSYMTFDRKIDYGKDIKLHDSLLESHHMSPFEHCARAMGRDYDTFIKGELTLEKITQNFQHYKMDREDRRNIGWCNNFKGFIQYRYLIENHYDGFRI